MSGIGAGRRRGFAGALALSVAALLVGGVAGPARADGAVATPVSTIGVPTTAAPGATILTIVPPNQTKILPGDQPTTSAITVAPTLAPAASSSSAGSSTAASSLRADSPGLRALVAASAADQRQADADVARSESDVAGLRAAFDAAQADLTARQGDEQAAQVQVLAAQAALAAADGRLAGAGLAALSAAAAVGSGRTPVASPPSPGHTLRDAAAQARQDVATASAARDVLAGGLAGRTQALDAATKATAASSVAFTARADDLQHGLDALDQARQQQAPATAAAAGTLRPAPTGLATATIPADYLTLYGRAAATCAGLPWVVLAAIGSVESAHGQSTAPGVTSGANVAGAMGPMQFLAGTWAAYGVDGDGDGVRDVYNPADAVFGAANYLCASGAGDLSTLRLALWDYNHADWYVEAVLQLAARY